MINNNDSNKNNDGNNNDLNGSSSQIVNQWGPIGEVLREFRSTENSFGVTAGELVYFGTCSLKGLLPPGDGHALTFFSN